MVLTTIRTTGSGVVSKEKSDAPSVQVTPHSNSGPSVTGLVQLSLAATTQALIRYDQLESGTAPEQFTERLTSSSPWTGASHSEKAAKHSDDRIGLGKSETRTKALPRSLATGERFSIKKTRRPVPSHTPPLIRQSRQDVLQPPERKEFENYFVPAQSLKMTGTREEKRQLSEALTQQAQERDWVTEFDKIKKTPPLDVFSINNYRLCAYAAKYNVPAASMFSIVAYTGDGYQDINPDMRKEKTLHLAEMSNAIPPWKRELIHDISNGLRLLPKAQNGTVCRKMIVDEELGQKLVPGNYFMDYAFMSTSFHKNFSGIPGNYLFIIVLKKNSSAVDISKFSRSPQEKEVLFPPGQRFKIAFREIDGKPTNEHVPYFDYDPDGEHKHMSAEEVSERRRVVKIYMYQV